MITLTNEEKEVPAKMTFNLNDVKLFREEVDEEGNIDPSSTIVILTGNYQYLLAYPYTKFRQLMTRTISLTNDKDNHFPFDTPQTPKGSE